MENHLKKIVWATWLAVLAAFTANSGLANPAEGELQNPVPASALSAFGHYELKELALGARDAGKAANEKAVAKIREHLATQVGSMVSAWNAAGATSGATTTLLIEPTVVNIKFIGGGARFWVGAMAGASYVTLKFRMTEQPSGRLIAEPEFFQRASAMSGAYTLGGQDNDMLQRVVTLVSGYLSTNYETAVGSPTGRPAPKEARKK